MADILIRGVEFPTMEQAYKTLIVSYDGKVYEGVHPQPTAKKKEPIAEAVELPPHGDLIDRRELLSTVMQVVTKFPTNNFAAIEHLDLVSALLRGATVVVPAERREE